MQTIAKRIVGCNCGNWKCFCCCFTTTSNEELFFLKSNSTNNTYRICKRPTCHAEMVQSPALSKLKMNHNNMSNNSSNASSDAQTAAMEIDVIAFQEIPLTALSKRTLRKLSNLLNSKKILRSEEGYERDWRGLASLAKQKFLCDEIALSGDDPTIKVIKLWCTNNAKTATFAYLELFLGIIDRWDVSDDIYENLVADTKIYKTKIQMCLHISPDENVTINSVNVYSNFGHGSDSNILTSSDVLRAQKGLPPQMYDAFVLYADADLNYASEMLTKLEDNPEYNFKLCMKDRDLLGGVQFEHVALTQLIEERCKHLIVILTKEFLKSPENSFLVNYTQAQQIQHKTRKIIPLLYEESVDIPRTLKIYTHLRYNPGTSSLLNFWSKLANSIQNVNGVTDIAISCFSSDTNRNSSTHRKAWTESACQVKILPSLPAAVPIISVVPPDESGKQSGRERPILKPITLHPYGMLKDESALRTARSTGQLHTSYQAKNSTSLSDLSTSSIGSETKKKRKWSSKILKKVFTRSSSKLQEA